MVGAGGLEPIFGHFRMSLEKQNRLCFFGIYGGDLFVRLRTQRTHHASKRVLSGTFSCAILEIDETSN